jgi:hypothetical protein
MPPKRFAYENGLKVKFQIMFWLQWLVGWLPKEKRNLFRDTLEKIIPPTGTLEYDDEDDEEGGADGAPKEE